MKKPLTTVDVSGKEYAVEIDRYGVFQTEVAGSLVTAHSLEGLITLLRKKVKTLKVVVAVPFYSESLGGLCVVTGKHGKTGNWTVKTGRGKAEQLRSLPWGVLRPLSASEIAELAALQEAERKARNATEDFRKGKEIRLEALVREALEKAEKEMAE